MDDKHYMTQRQIPSLERGVHLMKTKKGNTAIVAVFSKDKWNTKEDTGKSMKNASYALYYAKRHLSSLNSEKIKPVA